MIQVYGAAPTRGLRVLWMLEEMGLDYAFVPVDFAKRQEDTAFRAASPAAAFPAIVDGDVRMMESVAILQYLAARHGPTPLVPATADAGWPLFQQYLHFGEASLAAFLNVAVASRFFAPAEEKDNWGARAAVRMALQRSAVLEDQLQRTPFIAGEAFTAADISCAYPLGMLEALGQGDKLGAATRVYVERLRERPAYQRAMRHASPLLAAKT